MHNYIYFETLEVGPVTLVGDILQLQECILGKVLSHYYRMDWVKGLVH